MQGREAPEHTALVLASLCVGGMVLARAAGDDQLADNVREASHRHGLEILQPPRLS